MFVSIKEMVTIPRNRNATIAAGIVMFGQQFCGVNVIGAGFEVFFETRSHFSIAYYSSTVFVQAGFSQVSALLSSLGFGLINWIFALPAVFTIDTFGRRYCSFTFYNTFHDSRTCLETSYSLRFPGWRFACLLLGFPSGAKRKRDW